MSFKNEFYVNIKDKPEWKKNVAFNGQHRTVQQFYLQELKKIINGVRIGGVDIHPWIYWHVNFWNIFTDRNGQRVNELSSLRDNEWFFNENLLRADIPGKRKGIVMFGTRRYGKSATIASWTTWNAVTKYGGESSVNSIVGGNQPDLDNIAAYIEHGLQYLHPMFKYDRVGTDWAKGVTFGVKNKNNESDIFSKVTITNLDSGSAKATQKTAGATPMSWVCDEIGKFAFKKAWEAAKPSFDTGDDGWRCVPLLMGTSGQITEVVDAMSLVTNPEINNLISMNWDDLEKHTDKPTWTRKNWGIFVPGQMSLKIKKVKSNLAEYLKIEDESLEKIEIAITPWKEATESMEAELKLLKKKDITAYYNYRMFFPLDTDDCFLQDSFNPFPSSEGIVHKMHITESGDHGRYVELYRNPSSNEIEYNDSDKDLPKFPHEGGNIDAPYIIFEEPPEIGDRDIKQLYTAGLDHYKHDTSSGDSLGAFYIYKRMANAFDPHANTIVACYVSRPNTMDRFNYNVELLMKMYGAEVLQENADISFQQYLMRRNEIDLWLMNGEQIAQKYVNAKAYQNNKYGLTPNVRNLQYIFQLVVDYTWEIIDEGVDEDGLKVERLGITRIKDLMLLEEIINYKKGQNHDRILAFGYALAWAQYLDDTHQSPRKTQSNALEYEAEVKRRRLMKNVYSPYNTAGRKGFY